MVLGAHPLLVHPSSLSPSNRFLTFLPGLHLVSPAHPPTPCGSKGVVALRFFVLPHLVSKARGGREGWGRSAGSKRPSRSLRSVQGRRPARPPSISHCGVIDRREGSLARGVDNRHFMPLPSTTTGGVNVFAPAEQGRDGRWSSRVHASLGTHLRRELGSGGDRKASESQPLFLLQS